MELGIFDHLDRWEAPLDEFYESRLRLLERYDAAGFYSYHLAEHHATPLGLAPVPGIFLAAATQRTRRIRLGPCVYCLFAGGGHWPCCSRPDCAARPSQRRPEKATAGSAKSTGDRGA